LKGKIEASSSLSKKIEQLQRQSLTKMKPKFDQAKRAAEARFLNLRKQVTEKQSLERRRYTRHRKYSWAYNPRDGIRHRGPRTRFSARLR
jgi:poly-D-alanine transfer protein DltD